VDGKEWPAESEGEVASGERVKVVSLHGSKLKVKPA
jgi:membrane protein implicated in regulation of membrane protease activity